jgi:hypothetical protein
MFYVFCSLPVQIGSLEQIKIPSFIKPPQDPLYSWSVFFVLLMIFAKMFGLFLLFNLSGEGSKIKNYRRVLVFIFVGVFFLIVPVILSAFFFRVNNFIEERRVDLLKLEKTVDDNEKINPIDPDPEIKKNLDYTDEIKQNLEKYNKLLIIENMKKPVQWQLIEAELQNLGDVTKMIEENNKLQQDLNHIINEKAQLLDEKNQESLERQRKLSIFLNEDSALAEKNSMLQQAIAKQLENGLGLGQIKQVNNDIFFGQFKYTFQTGELFMAGGRTAGVSLEDYESGNIDIYERIIQYDSFVFQGDSLASLAKLNETTGLFEHDDEQILFVFFADLKILHLKTQKITIIKTPNKIIILSHQEGIIADQTEENLQFFSFFNPEHTTEYSPGNPPAKVSRIPAEKRLLAYFSEANFEYWNFQDQPSLKAKELPGSQGKIFLRTPDGIIIELDRKAPVDQ